MITVADLVEYRRRTEKLVERTAQVRLPTEYGDFSAIAYRETLTGRPHLALVRGRSTAPRTCSCACTPNV